MIVPALKVTIASLKEYENGLLETLGKLGVVELRDISGSLKRYHEEAEEKRNIYLEYLRKFDEILGKYCKECKYRELPELTLSEILSKVEKYINKFPIIEKELEKIKSKHSELKEEYEILYRISNSGLPLTDGTGITLTLVGVIDVKNVEKIENISTQIENTEIKILDYGENLKIVYVATLSTIGEEVRSFLENLEVKIIDIPKNFIANPKEYLDNLNKKIEKLQAKLKEIEVEKEKLVEELKREGMFLRRKIYTLAKIEEAKKNVFSGTYTFVVEGWIPREWSSKLEQVLKERFKNIVIIFEEPKHEEEAPVIFKNPDLLKDFESIVRQYGYPSLRDVDPTPLVGLLWPLMFGIMYPDAGQGIVILILGIILSRYIKGQVLGVNAKRLGKLFIPLGISAIIFGLLAGDFFLIETHPLLPGLVPKWIEKPQYIIWFIKISVFLGALKILLTYIINILKYTKEKEYIEAIFGEHGLAGMLIFISILIAGFLFFGISIAPGIEFPEEFFGQQVQRFPVHLYLRAG